MRVLGIMQNMWVRDPARVKAALHGVTEEFRRRYIARLMFACGGRSGKVLLSCLGKEWVNRITWDEASREIGNHSASRFHPDPEHIRATLLDVKPTHVVCFGGCARTACMTVQAEFPTVRFWFTLHPTCRNPMRLSILSDLQRKLNVELEQWPHAES